MPTNKLDGLRHVIGETVVAIHLSEYAFANELYVSLTEQLQGVLSQLDPQWLSAVLTEMLKAQQQQNYVWLADLLQFVLLPEVDRLGSGSTSC